MKKPFLIYFLCLFFAISPLSVSAAPVEPTETPASNNGEPAVSAEAAILMDATTGEILFEKNSEQKMYPASITKLMTVLLAYEEGNLSDPLTFSHDAVYSIEQGSAHIAMQEGEQITLEQGLYGILLRSANEVSNAVGEYIDGDMTTFAAHMTARAKELGAKGTNFVNANGLYNENHYTTAYDMALIAKALLQQEGYRNMMGSTYYEIPATNLQNEIRYLHGQHQMRNKKSTYYYEYATGGKTGFTSEAQNTLVTFAQKGDTQLIAVVLKCAGANHYVDTKALFEYGFANFQTAKLFPAAAYTKTVAVTETYKNKTETLDTLTVAPQTDVFKTLKQGESPSDYTVTLDCPETIEAPVTTGQTIGTLTVSAKDGTTTALPLLADKDVSPTTQEARMAMEKEQKNALLGTIGKIVLVVVIGFVLLICITRAIGNYKRKQRRKQRAARRRRTPQR